MNTEKDIKQIEEQLAFLFQANMKNNLLVEYVINKLMESNIELNMDDYPAWAQARYEEIQKDIQQAQQEMLKEAMADIQPGVNLEDE